MTATDPSTQGDAGAHASRPTLVFVHGFLDGAAAWDDVVAELGERAADALCLDLRGMGARVAEPGPYSLDGFAEDVAGQVRRLDRPVVLVGHSMGAQIAELAAGLLEERVRALVLLTPVPLAGTNLPDEAIRPFHGLGGNPEAQRGLRRQLAAHLSDAGLEKLGRLGDPVAAASVGVFADLWNRGHALGERESRFRGPTLIVRGEVDPFVTAEVVAHAVLPRFSNPAEATIAHAGHWPQVEQPKAVAGILGEFLLAAEATPRANTPAKGWTQAFAEKSSAAFAEAFAKEIVLEASVMTHPVVGIDQVKAVMGAASTIYEALAFTQQAADGPRTYLEWEAQAFGGEKLFGITILTRNEAGKIVRAAIHHRPLGVALKFSVELGQRLKGKVDASHFLGGA